nr:hypothetical protein [Paenibacillus sp. SYP-B3998]
MPSFGGSSNGPGKASEARQTVKQPYASMKQGKSREDGYMRPGAEPAMTTVLPEKKESLFGSASPLASVSAAMGSDTQHNSIALPEHPTTQQILQGVVWSEILGPPRSKKPFRR